MKGIRFSTGSKMNRLLNWYRLGGDGPVVVGDYLFVVGGWWQLFWWSTTRLVGMLHSTRKVGSYEEQIRSEDE